MTRLAALFTICFALAFAENGSRDPAFSRIPFDEWMTGAGQSQIRWDVNLEPIILSNHQRFLARINVQLDGAEIARRRGKGEFVIFFQLVDSQGRKFQDHNSIDLAKMEEGIKHNDVINTVTAFVLPGNYSLSVAILSTATQEHAVRKEKLHVAAMKGDPLPQAWEGLPAVEFRPTQQSPDMWFQPEIKGRLNLQATTHEVAKIDVLVNMTPSERATASQSVQDLGLAVMLPALKILANVEWHNTSLHVSLLDMLRQRIPFTQDNVKGIDWDKMRGSIGQAEPGKIDVKSLGERENQAQFFSTEVGKNLAPRHVVIVMSPMVAFEKGEDLTPISAALPPGCIVYYLRFHAPLSTKTVVRQPQPTFGRPMRGIAPPVRTALAPLQIDQLEATLKPLNPKLFDILSPEQFRAALSEMMSVISRQ